LTFNFRNQAGKKAVEKKAMSLRAKRVEGTVKTFSEGRGYITPSAGGKDVFVHFLAINKTDSSSFNAQGNLKLQAGDLVRFDIVRDEDAFVKTQAQNVELLRPAHPPACLIGEGGVDGTGQGGKGFERGNQGQALGHGKGCAVLFGGQKGKGGGKSKGNKGGKGKGIKGHSWTADAAASEVAGLSRTEAQRERMAQSRAPLHHERLLNWRSPASQEAFDDLTTTLFANSKSRSLNKLQDKWKAYNAKYKHRCNGLTIKQYLEQHPMFEVQGGTVRLRSEDAEEADVAQPAAASRQEAERERKASGRVIQDTAQASAAWQAAEEWADARWPPVKKEGREEPIRPLPPRNAPPAFLLVYQAKAGEATASLFSRGMGRKSTLQDVAGYRCNPIHGPAGLTLWWQEQQKLEGGKKLKGCMEPVKRAVPPEVGELEIKLLVADSYQGKVKRLLEDQLRGRIRTRPGDEGAPPAKRSRLWDALAAGRSVVDAIATGLGMR